MSTKIEMILLGEFKRLAKQADHLHFRAVEQPNGRYSILAIDHSKSSVTAFCVRHARKNEARTWQLGNIFDLLRELGVNDMSVVANIGSCNAD